jgi:hypothetical protein
MGKFLDLEGKRFVALRSAIEEMGGNVAWDNAKKEATVDLNGKVTVVAMNDADMTFDGQVLTLSAAPTVRDGALYVPEDFFPGILRLQLPF